MSAQQPNRVVIVGGGIAGVEAALALAAFAPGRADVTIVSPDRRLRLPPLSTQAPFGARPELDVPLAAVARAADARVVEGALDAVDLPRNRAVLADGEPVAYDRLIVAVGALRTPVLASAVTFGGASDIAPMRALLDLIVVRGDAPVPTHLAFVVPPGPGWPLPVYELALLTARHLSRHGVRRAVELAVVSPEDRPLGLLGAEASATIANDLRAAGIAMWMGAVVRDWAWGTLRLASGEHVAADRVVALPALRGPAIRGLPHNALGFLPVDPHGRVRATPGVFAVGDAASFTIKHGGLGAQQADTVAALIAAELGAPPPPTADAPVITSVLMGGDVIRLLRTDPLTGTGEATPGLTAAAGGRTKVVARFLTPLLDRLASRGSAAA